MKETILDAVNHVRTKNGLPPLNQFDPTARLREDIGLDSLDLAELTVRIEAASGVDIFANRLVRTLGEIEAELANGARS
jgi:acyl carrier protein